MYWISLVMRVEFAIFGRSTRTLVEVLPYFGCKTTSPCTMLVRVFICSFIILYCVYLQDSRSLYCSTVLCFNQFGCFNSIPCWMA